MAIPICVDINNLEISSSVYSKLLPIFINLNYGIQMYLPFLSSEINSSLILTGYLSKSYLEV